MPLFICEKCGTIENTATGCYWWAVNEGKPALCSECHDGKWHGYFEKKHFSELTEKEFEEMRFMNAEKFRKYFKKK